MSETIPQGTRAFDATSVAGVLGATVSAIAIWAVATTAGADLRISFGPGRPTQQITMINVVLAALVGTLGGWGLLVLLRAFTPKARAVWTMTAIVVALVSLAGPLSSVASTGTKVSLVSMHLVVATVLIVVLRRSPHT